MRPLSCLSASGILAALVTAFVIAGVGLARGGRMFSPGELNAQTANISLGGARFHAEIPACAECHAPFWASQRMADRCLDCHTNLMQDPQDFHRAMLTESEGRTCLRCHTDHNGREAGLTILDMEGFPHGEVGFSLRAHQRMIDGSPFACSDCHGVALSNLKQVNCETCHRDLDSPFLESHVEAFGQVCLTCHDGLDTYGADFDHNQLAFPLQGKHATACRECHGGARSPAELQAAATYCFACHAQDDPHAGRFGQECGVCHTPTGWEDATFDHSLVDFPLTGKHAEAACRECHLENADGTVFEGTPQECAACHAQDDAHAGQFGQDCGGCHTPASWEEATFDHSLAAFPLTGAHLEVSCEQCHLGGVFEGTPQECAACHSEPAYHQGIFDLDCAACHTSEAWTPARFDSPHTFPLNHGADAISDCRVCHPDSLSAYTCYGCHEHTPARIESKHREEGIGDIENCMRCHAGGLKEEGGGEDD